MKIILIVLLLCLQPKFSDALTFKRDGSVVSSSGVILKKSNAEKYQKALELFNNGKEVEEWPISNNNRKYRGYFGETMLRKGAPLFSIGKVSGSGDQLLESIAKNNGFASEDIFQIVLVANSSEEFQSKNNISKDTLNAIDNIYQMLESDPNLPSTQDLEVMLKDLSSVMSVQAQKSIRDSLRSIKDSVKSEVEQDSSVAEASEGGASSYDYGY
jgi:hypothetical protein